MNPDFQRKLPEIQELCRRNHVKSLHAFGSVLRADFSHNSDIDLVVEFEEATSTNAFQRFFEFKETMESLLGHPVDLISSRAISNPFFRKEVKSTKSAIYAA